MNTARLTVRALVVSDGRAGDLDAVLAAIDAQHTSPDIVNLVLVADAPEPLIPDSLHVSITRSVEPTYRDSLNAALRDFPALEREYLWLLHDDTIPHADALARLTAVARKRGQAGVVGPVHVRAGNDRRIVNAGSTVPWTGTRRVPLVQAEDINQGQYDERDDVMAVSLGGALVRRSTWEELGGLEDGYAGLGDGMDFCRRVWRSGADVVLVPAARVRHAQETLKGRRGRTASSIYVARRTGEWRHAWTWGAWWFLPVLLPWMLLSAIARSLVRVARNEPTMVLRELSVPWVVLYNLRTVPAARASIRRLGKRRGAADLVLVAGPRIILNELRSHRLRNTRGRFTYASLAAPHAQELRTIAVRRRTVIAGVLALAAAVSVVVHPGWLLGLLGGSMLTAPALGVTDVSTATLWDRWWWGWDATGFGAPALDSSWTALLAVGSIAGGDSRLAVGLILALGPLWAALASWAAVGTLARSLWVRGPAALVYAVWPPFMSALADGRLAAVVVHIALPMVALGLIRAGGWQRQERLDDGTEVPFKAAPSPSAAAAAAVAILVTVAAAPIMAAPLALAVVVAGAFAGRSRWFVWSALIPVGVVAWPTVRAAWATGDWFAAAAVLAREDAAALASVPPGAADVLAGGSSADVSGAALLSLGVVTLALVVLAVARSWLGAAVAAVVGGVGAAMAVGAPRLTVAQPDGAGFAGANGWMGMGASLVAIAAVMAVASASAGAWHTGRGAWRGVRRVTALVVLLAVSGGVVAVVVESALEEPEAQLSSVNVLPLAVALEAEAPTRSRVLLLSGTQTDVSFAVLSADGSQRVSGSATLLADGSPAARPGAALAQPSDLAPAVAQLVGAAEATTGVFADWGIGTIVVEAGAEGIAAQISRIPELVLAGSSDSGTSWRIPRTTGDALVTRAWLELDSGEVIPVPMSDARGGGEYLTEASGVLTVAVADDPGWQATLGGRPLERVADDGGRVAFAVAGTGTLSFEYVNSDYRRDRWLVIAVLAWSLLASVPVHRRRWMAVTG